MRACQQVKPSTIAIALVVSLGLLHGCTTQRGALIVAGVGLGIAGVGGVVASNPGDRPQSAMGNAYLGAGIAVVGGVVLLGSLINLAVVAAMESDE